MKIVSLIALTATVLAATAPGISLGAAYTSFDGTRQIVTGPGPGPNRPEPDRPQPDRPGDDGVDSPDSSTGNDDIPPEPPRLSCRFVYTDEGVVVVFVNTGGPIPPWQIMWATWDEPSSSSLSWTVAGDGMPGHSKYTSVPLNWDPEGKPCIATLEDWDVPH